MWEGVCSPGCRVVREFFGMHSRWGIRRRAGWVILTRCRIVLWGLDSERFGVYGFVCAGLVVVLLIVLDEGSRRWGTPTPCCLNFSHYLLVLPRLITLNSYPGRSFSLLPSVGLVVLLASVGFGWGWSWHVRRDVLVLGSWVGQVRVFPPLTGYLDS